MSKKIEQSVLALAAATVLAFAPLTPGNAADSTQPMPITGADVTRNVCRNDDVSVIKRVPGNERDGNVVGFVVGSGSGKVVATLGGGFAHRIDRHDLARHEVVTVEPTCTDGIALR